ncbi:hypothetical protein [Bradyrhizobium sp. SZCCHNRI2007]|uniref:hypothetical protein n=1 Tax=Bradyrhizobium sp. SZCCHNRI2007 TaxID=3057281 RepID=UPI0028F10040|nr:hypothetical protein [Bradyrhizobium sp. SZCCHNRI2007]
MIAAAGAFVKRNFRKIGERKPRDVSRIEPHLSATEDLLMQPQIIAVGKRTPFPVLQQDGAKIVIHRNSLTTIVQLSRPLNSEIRAIRRDRMDVSVLSVGTSAFLLWRFLSSAAGLPPILLETPFHLGMLPPEERGWHVRSAGKVYTIMIVIQDEKGIGYGGRFVSLPANVCDEIDRLVGLQVEEATMPGWSSSKHEANISEFYRIWPQVDQAWDFSDIEGRGCPSA